MIVRFELWEVIPWERGLSGSFVSHGVHGFNRVLSANVLSRCVSYLSQIFTDEQRPIC